MVRVRSFIIFFLVIFLLVISQVQADSSTNVSDYYLKGNELVTQGKLEDALQAFRTAGSQDQQSLDQTYGLAYQTGWILNRLGRYDEALAEYQNAEKNHPDWISEFAIYYNEGCLLAKLMRNDEAVQKFDQALATDSTSREAWFNKGLVLARMGRYAEAADALGRSRKAFGSFVPLLGSYQEAANTYDMAQGILHSEPAPEPAVTKATVTQVLPKPTFNPDVSTDLLMRQGAEYSSRYLYDDAVRAYSQVLANDPSNYRSMEAEAVALANLGRFSEALSLLDQAAPYVDRRIDEATWVDLWYVRGWVLASQGNYDGALDAFNKALSADPDAFPAYYNKAWVLSKKGDTNGAVAAYEQSLGWDNPQRLEIKSYSILGPVGTYKEAADAIDKTLTEKPLYISDFSTDPGWATTNSRNYYWDSGKQVYHFTGDENAGLADVPVFYKDTSFRLAFDITIIHADPGTTVHVGVSSHNTTYTTTDAIFTEFRSWKAGTFKDLKDGDKTYQIIAVANGQKKTNEETDYACFINREDDRRENTFGGNRTYHVVIDYDKDKGTISTKVSDNLHEKTYFNCAGSYNNVGAISNINQIILAALGTPQGYIEGYIDNVKLYATGIPGAVQPSGLWGTSAGASGNVSASGGNGDQSAAAGILPPGTLPLAAVLILASGVLIAIWYIRRPKPTFVAGHMVSDSARADLKNRGKHHDLFISYSSKDKPVADAICNSLENQSIRCWIAPRDVPPGQEFPEAIINAINDSKVMVLIFSANSNISPQVTRELTNAVSKNLFIIPFRIDNTPLSKNMEYLIGVPHWLDALTPPLERHIEILVRRIKVILKELDGEDLPEKQ
jgi:tetratricopeptide (TPR) repeat protein